MADVKDRDLKEEALARVTEKELVRFRKYLERKIPELRGALETIPPDAWTEHTDNLNAAIGPQLQNTYTEQAETMMDEFPFLDIDWGLLNSEASAWARTYTFDLIQGLNTTSERAVREAIASYFEQSWNQAQLRDALTPTFGPRRAELIAVTETTRAAVEGESETVRRLEEDDGIIMIAYWLTREDELVCPICGPRANKEIRPDNETQGEYPPAHPRCRCNVRHEIAE